MVRLRPDALVALFCIVAIAGCGGEIARIEGLPQTRDTSGVPWPRLVDVPAPPAGLQVETGAAALETLNRTRATVMARAALPGPERVARAELGDRVARIRREASTDMQGVDEAGLAARAARLARVRAVPVSGLPASELALRARRVAAARVTMVNGVDADGLQARARRIAAAQSSGAGGIGATELQRRARRVAAARAVPASEIDRTTLAARSDRIAARTQPDETLRTRLIPAIRPVAPAMPAPRPKPASPPNDRSTPVLSDAFLKRAEEARRRARERAAAEKAR